MGMLIGRPSMIGKSFALLVSPGWFLVEIVFLNGLTIVIRVWVIAAIHALPRPGNDARARATPGGG